LYSLQLVFQFILAISRRVVVTVLAGSKAFVESRDKMIESSAAT
jgi:hypothetical protein